MIIKNKDLKDYLLKKAKLVEDGREVTKKIDELETERRKIGLQIQKLKDKIIPLVNQEMEKNLGEFDEISTVDVKDGEVVIETVNVVENFKRDYLEAKKNQEAK